MGNKLRFLQTLSLAYLHINTLAHYPYSFAIFVIHHKRQDSVVSGITYYGESNYRNSLNATTQCHQGQIP